MERHMEIRKAVKMDTFGDPSEYISAMLRRQNMEKDYMTAKRELIANLIYSKYIKKTDGN